MESASIAIRDTHSNLVRSLRDVILKHLHSKNSISTQDECRRDSMLTSFEFDAVASLNTMAAIDMKWVNLQTIRDSTELIHVLC
jgi:hypothetical protein